MSKKIQPNFFIIGAAKAATTSLSSLLESHPQAGMVRPKEPHYFSYDHVYRGGWQKYLAMFSHCHDKKAVGDASTSYSRIRYYKSTLDRMKLHVPRARIIYMVRHPLKRMESAYVEHAATADSKAFRSINEAIRLQPMILDSSRYWEVFEAYRQKFDESRIKIIWFEEYTADTLAVFQDVCRFLEIDDTFAPDFAAEKTNSRAEAAARMEQIGRGGVEIDTNWDEAVRQSVVDQLREDNCKFLSYFGRPLDYWGDLFTKK
jgi:hypothetical protein